MCTPAALAKATARAAIWIDVGGVWLLAVRVALAASNVGVGVDDGGGTDDGITTALDEDELLPPYVDALALANGMWAGPTTLGIT